MISFPCPACQTSMEVFHVVEGVPANSCLLLDDAEQVRALPRGDLRLGFCRGCGFIANGAFCDDLTTYDSGYEETQGFSPRFRAFAADLARTWVDRFDLHRRRVLEVGCGKGEFLALLAELGENECVGVDPATDPSRVPVPARGSVRVLAEAYDERHASPGVDALVCRHTLEHVADVAGFLRGLRRGVQESTVLLFELPDTTRVLRETALEDVYYEHCSYFTRGSLARLFRRCGFTVLDVRLAYEGQYLVLEARPGPVDTSTGRDDLADIARTAQHVEHFSSAVEATRRHWRTRLESGRAQGRSTVLWGGGSKAVAFLTTVGVGAAVQAVVDINPHKQGRLLPGTGHPVVSPESLVARPPDLVVVMNAVYAEEIRSMLAALGLSPELDVLGTVL